MIIGTYTDDSMYERLAEAYSRTGVRVVKPAIANGNE
jgi:hypothetical protein